MRFTLQCSRTSSFRTLIAAVAALALIGTLADTASAQTPAADQIALRVNISTGEIRLIGNASDPGELAGYTITSGSSSLDSFNWESLSDNGEPDFIEFVQGDASVREQSIGAAATINATGRSLGNLFRVGGTQDLTFAYDEQDAGNVIIPFTGGVTYVPEPATGACVLAAVGLAAMRRRHR